jgi:hypothetical protein
LREPGEIIYNLHADERGMIVSRIVVATYGPEECVNWGSEIEKICLLTQYSRSAPVKFGIKASAMLSGLMLATAFVAGCTEETPTEGAKPANPPAAVGAPGTPSTKPGDVAVPPVTAPKAEEKK